MQKYTLDNLNIGMKTEYLKAVTEKDVQLFSEISGDKNPVHLDENFAKTTMFKTRIAHGMLTASHISAAIAMQLPGPGSIYLKQSLKFMAPVKLNDNVKTILEIIDIDKAKSFVTLKTDCFVEDNMVLSGEALILVPKK